MANLLSNALISMHINDSNATEHLSKKTDHGSMRFGHIRANVQAVRPNRLPQFRFASYHFEFLVVLKAFIDAVAAYLPTYLNQNDHPLVPICSDWLCVKVNKCPAHLFTGR